MTDAKKFLFPKFVIFRPGGKLANIRYDYSFSDVQNLEAAKLCLEKWNILDHPFYIYYWFDEAPSFVLNCLKDHEYI